MNSIPPGLAEGQHRATEHFEIVDHPRAARLRVRWTLGFSRGQLLRLARSRILETPAPT